METSLLVVIMPVVLVVLKASAVLLVALALTTLMQRASATSRHLVWVASMFALVAIPLLAVWSPVRFAVLPSALSVSGIVASGSVIASETTDESRPRHVVRGDGGDVPISMRQGEFGTANKAANTSANANPASLLDSALSSDFVTIPPVAIIAGVWAAVALGLMGWLAYGAWSVRRIVRRSTPLNDAAWQGTMIDIADRLQLDSTPRLLRAESVTMPFACGLRTPTIVLPGECESWSFERRAAVLLHELAHIRRRDIVGHTLGRLVCAVYWFHPLAWTAARRLRAESERACDDLALGCGTRASDYAEHLLDIVTSVRNHGTPSVAMAMATRSEFEGRMLAILDPSLMRAAPTRMQASTLAGGVMMFAIVTGSAVPKAPAPQTPQSPRQEAASAADIVIASDARASERQATHVDTLVIQRSVQRSLLRSVSGDLPAATNVNVQRVPVAPPERTADPAPSARPAPSAAPAPAVSGAGFALNPGRIGRVSPADSSARASVLARILRTDSAASLRRIAAWGLNEFNDNDAAIDALLYAVRRDASAEVREMAAWALADAADRPAVAAALVDAIRNEKDRTVRQTAVWSLGDGASGRSTKAIEALSIALADDDAPVRELAAWGIGNAGPRRAPAALVNALTDRDARVRATVAWALFNIEDGESATALETALQREADPKTKWALVRAISVMGERAVLPLQRLIEGSDAPLRALAIRALAGHGNDPWPQPRPRPRPFP